MVKRSGSIRERWTGNYVLIWSGLNTVHIYSDVAQHYPFVFSSILIQRMTDCQPGKKIYIQADAPRSGRLAVDLYGNDAWELSREGMPGVFRAIHINPRFDQNCVVRNSHQNGRWEQEERGGGMPIRPGERFIVCVTFQSHGFEIAFNGWHFATFRYRTQFTPTTTMILSMIERVNRIKYT